MDDDECGVLWRRSLPLARSFLVLIGKEWERIATSAEHDKVMLM